jgi:hypothetical protein
MEVPPLGVPLTPPLGPLPPFWSPSSFSVGGGGLHEAIATSATATQDGR